MLTVELIIRRGTDGPVIVRAVGDACHQLIWEAPNCYPILEGQERASQLLAGFTYKPSLLENDLRTKGADGDER